MDEQRRQRIDDARRTRGSVAALCRRLHISRGYYYQILGGRLPSYLLAADLAEDLGLPIELIGWARRKEAKC